MHHFFHHLTVLGLSMQEGADAARGTNQAANLFGATGVFTNISNILLFIVGAISVIVIIIAGLRYVVSGGNASAIAAAKNMILYAVVGILVALFAYAIINFVLGSFGAGVSSSGMDV